MSRERELLLLLVRWVRHQPHGADCPTQANDYAPCKCGHDDMMRAANYFTKNEPL